MFIYIDCDKDSTGLSVSSQVKPKDEEVCSYSYLITQLSYNNYDSNNPIVLIVLILL